MVPKQAKGRKSLVVVLPGVGSHIGQDGHLVDVGIVFWIYVFQFRVEGFIPSSGESGITFWDLGKRITFMEVGVVVISGQPGWCVVADFVGLGSEEFILNEAAEGFCISEVFHS